MTTISASSTIGIYLVSPSFTNPLVINPGVTISTGGNAIYGFTGAWTIQNSGGILSALGNGVYLGAGGAVTNAAAASISGVDGVNIAGGTGTVVNSGKITGDTTSSIGVLLAAGGGVSNQSGATISGYTGVDLTSGGSVTNASGASITGVYAAVQVFGGAGTVVNAGGIAGTGAAAIGIVLGSGGSITNAAAASIIGRAFGVDLSAGGTLTNAGTIVGSYGTAVYFGGTGGNRLVLDPGYGLSGKAIGGPSASNTLELASAASAGTLSGLGGEFVNFGQTTIDAGASWVLNGANTIAAGTTLTELSGATLTVSGTLADAGALNGSGVVTIGAGGTLQVQGTVAAGEMLINAGTLEFQSAAAANMTFSGAGGVLALDDPAGYGGTIANFLPGDTIFLSQNTFSSGGSATLLTGNTLQIVENSQTFDLRLNPAQDFSGAKFQLLLDANNVDTDLTVISPVPQAVATLNTPGPLTVANQHVNATPLVDILSITNAATAPAEDLDITIAGTTGSATGGGAINLLVAGATDSSDLSVGVNTSTAGARTGTVTLNEYTDGTGTDGAGKSLIGTSTVTVSGSVFRLASASVTKTVSFGNQHVGATLSQALSVSNTGTVDGFTEALDASIGSAAGSATAAGTFTGLVAGAANASALTVGLKTTKAGAQSGKATVTLKSDGGSGAGSIDGLGTTALAAQTITVSGTLFNYATASAAAPNPVSFGAHHVGDTLSQTLSVSNTGTAGSFTEALDASIGSATGSATAAGTFTGLAAGAANTSALTVGLSSAKDGVQSGKATLTLNSDGGSGAGSIDGLGTTALTAQTIAVSGTLFNYATASAAAPNPVNFGAHHVGDTLSQTLSVSNTGTVDGFTEALDASIGSATGSATAAGTFTGLVAGAANTSALTVGLNSAKDGVQSGKATLTLNSDGGSGAGSIDGLGTTALTAQTIAVSGTLFNYATASAAAPNPVNFGIVHVGDTVSDLLSISNTGTADGFTEALDAGFAGTSGAITALGTVHQLIASATDSADLAIHLVTSNAGTINGTANLGLVSDGTGIDNLGSTALSTETIAVTGTVNNYATAQFIESSGGGVLSQNGTAYTLDLGKLEINSGQQTIAISVFNAAVGQADLLEGNFSTALPVGPDPFTDNNVASFSGVVAGAADSGMSIVIDPTQLGSFSETITLFPTGYNSSGYSGALAAETLTIIELTMACFLRGTRILAQTGEVAVEDLRVGDMVRTRDGRLRPVRWMGHRRLDLTRHPAPAEVCPILIRAGALSDLVPSRDLRISPDHALFLDGGLVPARLLINGASIVREINWRHVTWYHVELDVHDVLLAEGAPAESYLDTGNRSTFENADEPVMLHPTFGDGQAGRVAHSCAPFVDDPEAVEPIWQRLAARAKSLGLELPEQPETTNDPGLTIHLNGRIISPVIVRDGRYCFVLPREAESVRVVSLATPPTALRPWLTDRRTLGVAVRRITLSEASSSRSETVPLDHPRLIEGWWAPERDETALWRWTNGNALLPLSTSGPTILEIEIFQAEGYRVEAHESSAA